jgi:hypothetical protein
MLTIFGNSLQTRQSSEFILYSFQNANCEGEINSEIVGLSNLETYPTAHCYGLGTLGQSIAFTGVAPWTARNGTATGLYSDLNCQSEATLEYAGKAGFGWDCWNGHVGSGN